MLQIVKEMPVLILVRIAVLEYEIGLARVLEPPLDHLGLLQQASHFFVVRIWGFGVLVGQGVGFARLYYGHVCCLVLQVRHVLRRIVQALIVEEKGVG